MPLNQQVTIPLLALRELALSQHAASNDDFADEMPPILYRS